MSRKRSGLFATIWCEAVKELKKLEEAESDWRAEEKYFIQRMGESEMEKNIIDNYEKQVYIGREWFMKYDQDKLIRKYGLKNDRDYLYLEYIGTEYRISRADGAIEYRKDEEWQVCREYTIVMTIYDLLCHSREEVLPPLTGEWQPVGGFVKTGSSPSTGVFTEKYEKAFSGKVEEVKQACIYLGGRLQKRLAGADITFEMPVISGFSVLFQFWDGDDEFPPKILILWDKASMTYLHFETTYYLQGDLLQAILDKIS